MVVVALQRFDVFEFDAWKLPDVDLGKRLTPLLGTPPCSSYAARQRAHDPLAKLLGNDHALRYGIGALVLFLEGTISNKKIVY